MRTIKEILLDRDGMSAQQAERLISQASEQLHWYLEHGDLDSAYNVCEEYFGLEPDYLTQLL